ncbi:MAG: carbohydrate ABC transporter permease [Treponema sp.]|jgi:putative aldouronate transport system permease protein|nr:carbohydrate ABC transporter permease [Treponema sp.]
MDGTIMTKEKTFGGIRKTRSMMLFLFFGYVIIILVALGCLFPFILLISGSFSSDNAIRFSGYSVFPRDFNTEAYKMIFKYPVKILHGYGVSAFITASGSIAGLFLITMTAYVISRKSFKYRNVLSFFFYFTTLFSGGMVSTYIFYIQYLHLKDSLLSLILPGLFNVFYLLIMRSFIAAIPPALIESAKIDGAEEFSIFIKIIVPLLPSALATIGLFMVLYYWNDWYNAMLYINSPSKFPLQYMLYDMMMQSQALALMANQIGIRVEEVPANSLKMAMVLVATGPVVLVYPFVQKYFVKGITIGSVKG